MPEVSVTTPDLFASEFAAPDLSQLTTPEETDDVEQESTLNGSPTDDAGEDDDIHQNDQGDYVQEIDLGDGAGKQVFKSKSLSGLVKELTKAQENATRKIRQQEFDLKRKVRVQPERIEAEVKKAARELTADELFAISMEMQTNPKAALDKLLEAEAGLSLKELGELKNQLTSDLMKQQMQTAQVEFVTEHKDDFLPSASNAKTIEEFLVKEKLGLTKTNLEYAFQELTAGGLLDMPTPKQQEQTDETQVDGNDSRIAVKPHTRQKPSSTGIKNSQGANRASSLVNEKSEYEKAVEVIKNEPDLDKARMAMLKLMNSKKTA